MAVNSLRFQADARGCAIWSSDDPEEQCDGPSHNSTEVNMLRPMTLSTITALALLTLTTPAAAQVTLEQLDAAADAKDASMEEFRKRLNDPDPDRALDR